MRALEIGDFKEDVGAALARASSGEVVTLTEEGQPVAELGPVRMSTYAQLRELGLERPVQEPARRAGSRRQTRRVDAQRGGASALPPALGAVRGLRVQRVLGPRVLRVAPA